MLVDVACAQYNLKNNIDMEVSYVYTCGANHCCLKNEKLDIKLPKFPKTVYFMTLFAYNQASTPCLQARPVVSISIT